VEARTQRVLVYTVDGVHLDWSSNPATLLYVCRRRSGERLLMWTSLHERRWDEHTHDYRIAGRYVAWVNTWSDGYGQAEYIDVYNVARGKLGHGWWIASRDDERVPPSRVSSLTLTRDGDLAWAVKTYDHPPFGVEVEPRERRRVEMADQFGRLVLDSSLAIDLGSVSIAGGRVRWVDRGVRRSAPLYATGRRAPCSFPRGARRRARTRQSVAYSYDSGRVRHVRACIFRSGLRRVLADVRPPGQRVQKLTLAGPFAGFVGYSGVGGDNRAHRVEARSVDLRSGRTKWTSAVGFNPSGGNAAYAEGTLVLAPNGAFAYTVTEWRTHPHSTTWMNRVRARYPGGGGTLDEGPAIDTLSLRLDGFTATWLNDGEVRLQVLR
jgi:hypothetical protein